MKTITFLNYKCNIVKEQYTNGRTALLLIDVDDNEHVATATVNLPDDDIPEKYVAIKDYSENEGMLNLLIKEKIVAQPVEHINSGFVNIPICKLLI